MTMTGEYIRKIIDELLDTLDLLEKIANQIEEEDDNDVLEIEQQLFGYRFSSLSSDDRIILSYLKKLCKESTSEFVAIKQKDIAKELKISFYAVRKSLQNLTFRRLIEVKKIDTNHNAYKYLEKTQGNLNLF